MTRMTHADLLKEQYADGKRLGTRASLHAKYSVNKHGYENWIFEQYELKGGMRILEVGCGTGMLWANHWASLPDGCELVLTDVSAGMVTEALSNVPSADFVKIELADVQHLPYADGAFDMVAANMMLYHVLDLDAGLREVCRVLKPDGWFYCTTYGENGIAQYLKAELSGLVQMEAPSTVFTLQNGAGRLSRYFDSVERRDYEDALAVTDANDLVDYLVSMASMIGLEQGATRETLVDRLEQKRKGGVIRVPKEYGMFCCQKA